MNKLIVAGDISKEKIDFCVSNGKIIFSEQVILNNKTELTKFFNSIYRLHKSLTIETPDLQLIFVFEHTGIYNNIINSILLKKKATFALIHPGSLKAVVGIDRNKTDKIDAKRIGDFAIRFSDKLQYFSVCDKDITVLKHLISARDRYVRTLSGFKATCGEIKKFCDKDQIESFIHLDGNVIQTLEENIIKIEVEIQKLIKQNEKMNASFLAATSVPGVGLITAAFLISYSNNFDRFKNAKQFGSYCGVVPFERSSGAFKGKSRVSQKANTKIKTLLHMCALSAAYSDNEFANYYTRKVAEGKNKLLVLNNLRNKILTTVFSCVTNDTHYQKGFIYQN